MNTQFITLILRHALSVVSGYLVTVGFIQESQTEAFIGAVLFIITLILSYANKKKLIEKE
jgi:hypothetical protein